jgi:hypothetical protein
MHRMPRDRFAAWHDLDALVGAEFDALDRHRPDHADARDTPPAFDEPEFADAPFEEEGDDEEAFIERTAAWLRNRSDADALIDAIRAALDDVAEMPAETPSADIMGAEDIPPDGAPGEG